MEKQYNNIYMKRFLYFNIYVIKGTNGDILIDTGFIGTKKSIEKWLDSFNIKLIILTHAHVDHIWNASYLKEKYHCQIALSKNDIKNLDNQYINSKPLKNRYKIWTKIMNFGMKHFKPKQFSIDIPLQDKQIINKFGIKLKIISLPGHTDGSIGILYNNYLFAGDALVYRGKNPSLAFQNQNNDDSYHSYQKIIKLKPNIIFIGHDKEINYDTLKNTKI